MPISEGVDVIDMMHAFGLAVVVVTRPNLGTINHTLLTIDAVRHAGLKLAGLVVSGHDQRHATIAEETVFDVLTEWGRTRILAVVPRDPESDVEAGRLGNAALDALRLCDWRRIARSSRAT